MNLADLLTPMALRVAATLRLADHVAAGVDTVPELAKRTGSDPDALQRLVNHLVAVGVLTDTLTLTDLGEELREQQAWLDIEGALGRADLSAFRLLDTVRTGRPAYPLTYGRGIWEDLAADPALHASFDALMSARLRDEAPRIAAAYDWGALGHVVDVGGGDGTLLAAILAAHPTVRGTLLDLAVPAGARFEVVAGSFFDPLPPADAYILSGVLVDWDDEHALRILRRCAEAGGRTIVIEHCELHDTAGDLRMLAFTGGRERTLPELERLAATAGLRVTAVRQATRLRTLVELREARNRSA